MMELINFKQSKQRPDEVSNVAPGGDFPKLDTPKLWKWATLRGSEKRKRRTRLRLHLG